MCIDEVHTHILQIDQHGKCYVPIDIHNSMYLDNILIYQGDVIVEAGILLHITMGTQDDMLIYDRKHCHTRQYKTTATQMVIHMYDLRTHKRLECDDYHITFTMCRKLLM